ncbi:Chromosome segregation ATPase, partial [Giardia duodenalis]
VNKISGILSYYCTITEMIDSYTKDNRDKSRK